MSGDTELAVLLAAAASAAGCPDRDPAATDVDWQRLLALAERHGLAPILHAYLDAADREPPADVREELADEARATNLRNLELAGELHDVVDALRERDVRALPYKGPVLAAVAYGDLGLRPFGDLDVLVHRADLPAAADALRSRDLALETDLGPYDLADATDPSPHLPFPHELKFEDPDRALQVELRVAHGDRYGDAPLDVEALWANRTTVAVAGRELPALDPADRLAVLAAHGAKHAWRRLEWVASLAGAAERGDAASTGREYAASTERGDAAVDDDAIAGDDATTTADGDASADDAAVDDDASTAWSAGRDAARDRDALSEFHSGALLAADLLGADLPEAVERAARADDRAASVAADVRDDLAADPFALPGALAVQRVRGALRGDRARRYLAFATRPTTAEYRALPLPEPLWPCYRLVRLVRGVLWLARTPGE